MTAASSRLNPSQREVALERLGSETFDVLVIGGGAVGAGCALDAATRGVKVACIEKRDWAAGTSSRSSKLIHGGLRYLQHGEIGLVRESLHERERLVRVVAPHLVGRLPFLMPLKPGVRDRMGVTAALRLYDRLAQTPPELRHQTIDREEALELAPSLRSDQVVGAATFFDAQVDDARLVITLVRTATASGAVCANAVRVMALARAAGTTVVDAVDEMTGTHLEVRARSVINATGVWSGELERLAGVPTPVEVHAAKGIHLVVPGHRVQASRALIFRTQHSVLFIAPWKGRWIVGTTDTAWRFSRDDPAPTHADVDAVLGEANRWLADPLAQSDVIGIYAGLRPLVGADRPTTADISRTHIVRRPLPGFVTIVGGKLTTYRVMAEDAVDAALADARINAAPSATASLPLLGTDGIADGFLALREHPGAARLDAPTLGHLCARYGSVAGEILDLVAVEPELAAAFADGYIAADIVHSATHEGALTLADILARRTRLAFEDPRQPREMASRAAQLVLAALGWDSQRSGAEVARYEAAITAERAAAEMPDDESAERVVRAAHAQVV